MWVNALAFFLVETNLFSQFFITHIPESNMLHLIGNSFHVLSWGVELKVLFGLIRKERHNTLVL